MLGKNKLYKQKELKVFLMENKVSLRAVLEHRVTSPKVEQIIQKVTKGWKLCNNCNASSRGRIWVIWNPSMIDFQLVQEHTQLIHGKVHIHALQLSFYMTAIYGLHTINDRRALLTELEQIHQNMDEAWIAMGDYNAVLELGDRVHETQIQDSEVRDFREFMEDTSMVELRYFGRQYTWSNSHVTSKIDKAIVNTH